MKYVIIGNSAAAIGAVEAIRKTDRTGQILILSSEPYHTYSRPLISYLLLGKTTEEKMLYRDRDFYERMHCDFRPNTTVVKLDPEQKQVLLADGSAESYDRVLVATGSSPFVPPMAGLDTVEHKTTFGSLEDVFDAPVEELVRRGGLTENAATLIKLTIAVTRRYRIRRASTDLIMSNTQKYGAYLVPQFIGARDEMVYIMALDAKCKMLGCTKLFSGTVNTSSLYVRSVVEYALRMKATSIVLAHNHTSGVAAPSQQDLAITLQIKDALELVSIFLADHIIVADDDFVSLLESGMMSR